jgi:hypothetical protein
MSFCRDATQICTNAFNYRTVGTTYLLPKSYEIYSVYSVYGDFQGLLMAPRVSPMQGRGLRPFGYSVRLFRIP